MRRIASFFRNKDGVAAVEFAMVVGPMLFLLLGGVEISSVLTLDRKVTSVAASVADLVAQASTITNSDRDNIFAAADALMTPYDPAQLQVVVSSIVLQNNQPTVAWSDATPGATARSVGSVLSVGSNDGQIPSGIIDATTSVIMAEVKYEYQDPTAHMLTGSHNFGANFFNRPRKVIAVARKP
jgi:Flp pilus assembly protein TadG